MDNFQYGQATARFAINLMKCRTALKGRPCMDGHLFFEVCPCEDCGYNMENGYFPSLFCVLCDEIWEEPNLDDEEDDDEVDD